MDPQGIRGEGLGGPRRPQTQIKVPKVPSSIRIQSVQMISRCYKLQNPGSYKLQKQ
jgi:hypothetical protein